MNSQFHVASVLLFAAARLQAQDNSRGANPSEPLPCFEQPSPLAVLRRSHAPVKPDAKESVLIVRLGPPDSLGRAGQVMLWGVNSGGGGPFDEVGSVRLEHRDVGIHRLSVRGSSDQEKPWNYIVTIRGGVTDTVVVDLKASCSQLFKRPSEP